MDYPSSSHHHLQKLVPHVTLGFPGVHWWRRGCWVQGRALRRTPLLGFILKAPLKWDMWLALHDTSF